MHVSSPLATTHGIKIQIGESEIVHVTTNIKSYNSCMKKLHKMHAGVQVKMKEHAFKTMFLKHSIQTMFSAFIAK